ncbi:hypothetical protein [Natrarchaeobius oligotrophus]|nr:hypothetical protein [Natrarchaeobius chitinivorans]
MTFGWRARRRDVPSRGDWTSYRLERARREHLETASGHVKSVERSLDPG